MSRAHIAPVEQHPAKPEIIDEHARELARLAEQALRTDELTQRAFEPATAHWEGLGAHELFTAPVRIKRRVAAGSEALAWAAAALHYWAERVRTFNQVVADIQDRWSATLRPVIAGVPVPLDGVVHAFGLPDNFEHFREEWWTAYRTYIEEGEDQVAAMLREGPSLAHVRLIREVGPVPESGAWSFFHARWDAQVAPELAVELAVLLAEPGYLPTLEEVEQFAALLGQHADDPRFAHTLLSALTPEQLLQLTANLSGRSLDVVQVSAHGPSEAWASALGQVQEGLGVALATATVRHGEYGADGAYHPGEHELDPSWVAALIEAGEKTYPISGDWPHRPPEVYGFQLLAPMLRHGDFNPRILAQVGGAMVDFEQANGGSGVWTTAADLYGSDELGGGAYGGGAHQIRLAWSGDWDDPYAEAGFDPVLGLMSALERNPEAARLFLTGGLQDDRQVEVRIDATGQEHWVYTGVGREYLPRLDYLLTERSWFADVNDPHLHPAGWADDWSQHNPGHAAFGRVLEVAVTDDPTDPRAVLLTEQVVVELCDDLRSDGNIVPAAMRESVAKIIAPYIAQLNQNVFRYPLGVEGPWGSNSRYDLEHQLELRTTNRTNLRNLLEDLGRDEAAQEVIRVAQLDYLWQQYEHHLTGPMENEPSLDRRLDRMIGEAATTAEILCALDRGLVEDTRLTMEEQVERLASRRAGESLMIDALATLPHPAARVAAMLAAMVHGADTSVVDLQDSNHSQLEQLVGQLMDENRILAEQMFLEAVIQFAPNELPPELLHPETGAPIPTAEWSEMHYVAWSKFLETDTGKGISDAMGEAGEKFAIHQ